MPEPSLTLVEGFLVDVFHSVLSLDHGSPRAPAHLAGALPGHPHPDVADGGTMIEASTLTGAIRGFSGQQGDHHG